MIHPKNPTAIPYTAHCRSSDTDNSSAVTITFSEAVTGFSNADVTVTGGTLSASAFVDAVVTWAGPFPATDGVKTNGSMKVTWAYTDLAVNVSATALSDSVV